MSIFYAAEGSRFSRTGRQRRAVYNSGMSPAAASRARTRLLWVGVPGPDATFESPESGGVVLFGRNLDPDPAAGPERCHRLIRELQARWGASQPIVVALDQEGGRVSRLQPWVGDTPTLRRIWSAGGAGACEAWGRLWGEGLAFLGFNTDLAPVADLWAEAAAMGDRSASADPREAARAAGAFLHGLEATGVRGCLKHFPGLGGLALDSHLDLPERRDSLEPHLEPFRMLAHGDRLVMVAHLRTPFSEGLPASLHRGHVAGNPWNIPGRWVTDDLEMGAVTAWPWPERVRLAVEAGHEALLVCQTPEAVHEAAEALLALPEPAPRAPLRFPGCRPSPTFDRAAWKRWVERVQAASVALAV